MPSTWLLFDRIRAYARASRVYQHERIFQDQSQLDRITAGAEFLDWNQQAAILDQTNLQINRLQRYKDYDQMDQTGVISLALDLYADESSLIDPERKHTLIIRARNRRLKKELEELFFQTLQWDSQCRPTIRYLCKFGDCPYEIIPTKNRDGVASIKHMNVYNFTRIETRHGDLVGFFFQDELIPEPVFLHPWQVMHLRLTSLENIYHPYGRAILDGGRKAFKQLRLMEDAALIYRITRAPEKRKFKIPVGLIPAKEVPEYMQLIARQFKRHRFYNPSTGTFDERYSPMIQEDDIFLPQRPDGTGPDVDTLQGAENLDAIADIEYFKKNMVAPMKIPFARVGIGQDAGGASEKSLSAVHPEFAKAVQWVQREAAAGLTKVAIIHLALRGYSAEDLRGFELALPSTSAIEELYRIETWQTRVQVMSDLKELSWFPKEWIVTHFTDLTPDEIQELKEMEEMAAEGDEEGMEGGEGGGGGGLGGGGGGLGGGADAGGDAGGLGGGDAMGGGLGGDDAGGGLGGDDAGAEAPPEGGGLGERYDMAAEKRVLTELRRRGKSKRVMEMVQKWARRRGMDEAPSGMPMNHFQALLESKELDGLSASKPEDLESAGAGSGVLSEDVAAKLPGFSSAPYSDSDENLLVEWSVPEGDRETAIRDTLMVLRGEEDEAVVEEEITTADLPS